MLRHIKVVPDIRVSGPGIIRIDVLFVSRHGKSSAASHQGAASGDTSPDTFERRSKAIRIGIDVSKTGNTEEG